MGRNPDRGRNFTRYAFTPTVKEIQSEHGSREAYERMEAMAQHELGAKERRFISERDSFYMATVGNNGWPYVQHRGGPPGFVRVVDDNTMAFADFRGNRQYVSTGNVIDTRRAAMIFVDYPARQRLKVWANAAIVSPDADPGLAAIVSLEGYDAVVERIFRLEVVAFDWNCPQHITPRYTLEEIEALRI